MRSVFFRTLILLCLLSGPVFAQSAKPDESQLLVPPPMLEPANPDGTRCFTVANKAPYTVTGAIMTNYYTNMVGQKGRGTSNFRLGPGMEEKFCTVGPYYPGTRVGFMIRTLIPIFSCYTVAQGTLDVQGQFEADGKTKTWANCQ